MTKDDDKGKATILNKLGGRQVHSTFPQIITAESAVPPTLSSVHFHAPILTKVATDHHSQCPFPSPIQRC